MHFFILNTYISRQQIKTKNCNKAAWNWIIRNLIKTCCKLARFMVQDNMLRKLINICVVNAEVVWIRSQFIAVPSLHTVIGNCVEVLWTNCSKIEHIQYHANLNNLTSTCIWNNYNWWFYECNENVDLNV